MIIKYDATNISPAEPNSPKFKAACGDPPSLTFTKKVPIIDITIPTAANTKGRYTAPRPPKFPPNSGSVAYTAPRTIVPIIEPT